VNLKDASILQAQSFGRPSKIPDELRNLYLEKSRIKYEWRDRCNCYPSAARVPVITLIACHSIRYFLPFATRRRFYFNVRRTWILVLASRHESNRKAIGSIRKNRPKLIREPTGKSKFTTAVMSAASTKSMTNQNFFGDLRNNCTSFVAWFPWRRRPRFSEMTKEILKTLPYLRSVDFVEDWENPLKFSKELKILGYKYENHDADHDPLYVSAGATIQSPVYKVTVNISLAIRKALRRYLGLEPPLPGSKMR